MEQQEPVPVIDDCGCDDDCDCQIACEIDLRPAGAPGMPELASSVRTVRRDDAGRLYVEFEPEAADRVQEMVDAERQCCPQYGWDYERQEAALRVTAPPNVLEIFEAVLKGA